MNYQKITFSLTPESQDFRDILMASLAEIGFESFTENDETLDGYIPEPAFDANQLQALDFSPLFTFEWNSELIPDQNWNEVWEKNYFKPLLVANKCLIRAPFHTDYPQADYEIVIEPKMAFGTGNHETTSLVMEYILENDYTNCEVLDMGCGTGILGILASMRGAKHVTSIDIDSWSFESTSENSELNQRHNVTALLGDAALLTNFQEHFNWIFANIHKNILISDVATYSQAMKPNAHLVMSGFYNEDLNDIRDAAKAQNLEYLSHKTNNNWVAALFIKNNQ